MIILLRRHSYTFNWESDSSGITDSCLCCGQPHSAHPTAKNNKVKDLALIFWPVFLPYQDFIFCQNHLEQAFSTYFFTHIYLMRCLSSMVNFIAVMTLLLTSGLHCCQQRIVTKNTNYFYAVRISISLAILSEIFSQIRISYNTWNGCNGNSFPVP